jgi:hypothetical protein
MTQLRGRGWREGCWALVAMAALGTAAPAGAIQVFRASFEGEADVKVYVTDSALEADCVIFEASYLEQAGGRLDMWFWQRDRSQADLVIYLTDTDTLAVRRIHFTRDPAEALCRIDWYASRQ